ADVFLGVAGADLQMHGFEPCLLAALRETTHDAVLVGPERRVIAANTPRWLVGSRLPETPRAGGGELVAVGEVGLDSGWSLALAARPHRPAPGATAGPRPHQGGGQRRRAGRAIRRPWPVCGDGGG